MPDIEQKLNLLKNEVDALQIVVSERSKPWYLNVPTIISLIALLFSFGTTVVSYKRTIDQDISNSRAELRQVLQRLVELPKEAAISQTTYRANPQLQFAISGLINQENSFLVAQTDGIIRRIPEGAISAGEYYSIALAYQYSYQLNKAKEYFNTAYRLAMQSSDFNTELAALRAGAGLSFATGEISSGRQSFEKSLEIFVRYPYYDNFTKNTTNVYTLISWATSELSFGDQRAAESQLNSAEQLLENLPPSPLTDQFRSQAASVRTAISQIR